MTDKNQTSSALAETLALLRSHGVASAHFDGDGRLSQVDFFHEMPAPVSSDDDEAMKARQGIVDRSLAFLGNRGVARRKETEETE